MGKREIKHPDNSVEIVYKNIDGALDAWFRTGSLFRTEDDHNFINTLGLRLVNLLAHVDRVNEDSPSLPPLTDLSLALRLFYKVGWVYPVDNEPEFYKTLIQRAEEMMQQIAPEENNVERKVRRRIFGKQ